MYTLRGTRRPYPRNPQLEACSLVFEGPWGALGALLGPLGELLGTSWALLGGSQALGSLLERFSRSCGAILEAIGVILGTSWTVLKPSRRRFGSSWGPDRIPKVALWGCQRVPNGAPEMTCAQHGETTKVEHSTKDFNECWGPAASSLGQNCNTIGSWTSWKHV